MRKAKGENQDDWLSVRVFANRTRTLGWFGMCIGRTRGAQKLDECIWHKRQRQWLGMSGSQWELVGVLRNSGSGNVID